MIFFYTAPNAEEGPQDPSRSIEGLLIYSNRGLLVRVRRTTASFSNLTAGIKLGLDFRSVPNRGRRSAPREMALKSLVSWSMSRKTVVSRDIASPGTRGNVAQNRISNYQGASKL